MADDGLHLKAAGDQLAAEAAGAEEAPYTFGRLRLPVSRSPSEAPAETPVTEPCPGVQAIDRHEWTKAIRYRDHELPAGPQHAVNLGERRPIPAKVLHHAHADHRVETLRREGHRLNVADFESRVASEGGLGDIRARPRDQLLADIDTRDAASAREQRQRDFSRCSPHVEHIAIVAIE
jgi:hypothetical protein